MAKKHKARRKNPPKAGSRAAKRGGRRAAATRARKHAIRVRAGRKAARTRARRHGGGKRKTARRSSKRRAHKRSKKRYSKTKREMHRMRGLKSAATRARRRKKLPEHETDAEGMVWEKSRRRSKRRKNPASEAAETSRRRVRSRKAPKRRTSHRRKRPGHKKHHVRRHYRKVPGKKRRVLVRGHRSHEESRRRRRSNPIDGWKEMLAGVFGVASGYVIASGGDRFYMTHALTGSVVNGQANLTDTPSAGSIYNSEALSLPIWSSWGRLGVAALSVGAPLLVASKVRSSAWKSFFQLAGFGALARTAGKASDDGVAALAMKMPNPTLVRLYAPEMAASAALSAANLNPQAGVPAGTFARLLGRFLGDTINASDTGRPCPDGYTLDVGGSTCSTPNVLPPPPAVQTAPPTTTTYPPSGGGGEPPYVPPTSTPPGGSPPVTVNVPVSTPSRAPFNPLTCSPDPDPC